MPSAGGRRARALSFAPWVGSAVIVLIVIIVIIIREDNHEISLPTGSILNCIASGGVLPWDLAAFPQLPVGLAGSPVKVVA